MPRLNKKMKKLFNLINWIINKAILVCICYILYLSTEYFNTGYMIEAFYLVFLCFMILVLNSERKK